MVCLFLRDIYIFIYMYSLYKVEEVITIRDLLVKFHTKRPTSWKGPSYVPGEIDKVFVFV